MHTLILFILEKINMRKMCFELQTLDIVSSKHSEETLPSNEHFLANEKISNDKYTDKISKFHPKKVQLQWVKLNSKLSH